eukprot:TRINITY_DN28324_c0_g1_i1.p1 TRINITY_DN28324_c0_g1~~TRINITY_DN28324_c0_g1_i1.p1  ORF type:complete len:412 (+),score=80.52 TRINITY_DN28324_c0_g1_i1:27-1262(+)
MAPTSDVTLAAAPLDGESKNEVHTQRWYYYKGPVSCADSWGARCCLFAGSTHPSLARDVAKYLGIPLSKAAVGSFADSEISIEVRDTVRGRDVFVLQPVCRRCPHASVNDSLVELLLFVSALRRSSARSITAVMPYYAYARQDRRMGRVPIAAADVARALAELGVDRVVSVDLHCGQIEGFFPPSVPVDNLPGCAVAACYFAERGLDNAVVVSPDAGGVRRAKDFCATMKLVARGLRGRDASVDAEQHGNGVAEKTDGSHQQLAILVKQRGGASAIERMDLIGSVRGRDVVLVDDILDTAGTLCAAAAECRRHGAQRVFAFCTHGLFSGAAPRKLAEACAAGDLTEIVITNTVPQQFGDSWRAACGELPPPRIRVLSLAAMIAEAIRRISYNERLNLTNMTAHVLEPLGKL